jgi:hypothetical protein
MEIYNWLTCENRRDMKAVRIRNSGTSYDKNSLQ